VVLLLRTAYYNMSKLKDVYMHQNTLAALANVAPHMSGMSSHAAQRLVSLFDMLSRRCDCQTFRHATYCRGCLYC
jgi:hypothetical protein